MSQHTTTSHFLEGFTVTDLECPCNWLTPSEPRDFSFEGDYEELCRELERDHHSSKCTLYYVVLDEPEGSLWSVWRRYNAN